MVFDSDIEKKIIEFVKKSPIGVTSSEIANYLNVNRITLSKYLSVIKERALIDFKQLGMAKLWYIPVKMNRDIFLTHIISELAFNLDKTQLKDALTKVGLKLGKQIDALYKQFYGVEKLNIDQLTNAVIDIEKKIGAEFAIVEKTPEKIILRNTRCPFGNDNIKKCPEVCSITSNIFGTIAAKNSEYSKVCLKKTIARADEDYIVIFLKKTEESEKEKATDYISTG